ncbi:MAG: hypothetical protein V2I46_00450 [Bacteroides sp.]|nr:hypothetical protein [Bacteroides sp.]
MKKSTILALILLFSTFLIPGMSGCKRDNVPGKRDVQMVLEDHFRREIYKDYVEVLDVDIVEGMEADYMGGKYYDVRINARIRVKKGHVISKRYTATSFEMNEEWAERYEEELAAAKTDEEREDVKNLFSNNTFSEGTHEIEGMLGFALLDEKWRLLTMMLGPQTPKDLR